MIYFTVATLGAIICTFSCLVVLSICVYLYHVSVLPFLYGIVRHIYR
jgi:hypothetical protein